MNSIQDFLSNCLGESVNSETGGAGIVEHLFVEQVSTTEYGWEVFRSFFRPLQGFELQRTSLSSLRALKKQIKDNLRMKGSSGY